MIIKRGFLESTTYDVIIKIDTSYFYGVIDGFYKTPYLIEINEKIHIERLK